MIDDSELDLVMGEADEMMTYSDKSFIWAAAIVTGVHVLILALSVILWSVIKNGRTLTNTSSANDQASGFEMGSI